MTKLADFWNKRVKKGWKHFSEQMTPLKIDYTVGLFQEHALDCIEKPNTSIDWGCGGGLLSKTLLDWSPDCRATIVDISKESLDVAEKFIEHPVRKALVQEEVSETKVPSGVDFLFCYSVVQHFPSLDYWQEVANFWSQFVQPEYIAIRTKVGDKDCEAEDYYKGRNFLRGLVLSWDSLLKPFDNYEVVHRHEGVTKSNQQEGFLVLRKK